MLCATSSFCDARRPSSTLSCVVALSRSDMLASLSSTSLFTRPRSRLSCSMATSIWAICALAEATVPRYCVTCVSYSRLSICPRTWPRTTWSPSFTLRESRSPVTLLLTFTVSRAWRCPAAVTTRVTVPFFATEVVTSAGGGPFGRRPCTVAKPTTATTIPARIQRPFVMSLSTLCAAQGRLGLAAVHQRSNHVELGLRELQLRVAHLQLRTHTHLLPGAREPQAFLRRLLRLLRDAGLGARGGELRHRFLHVGGDAAASAGEIVLGERNLDLRLAHVGLRRKAGEEVPGQVQRHAAVAVAARSLEVPADVVAGPSLPEAIRRERRPVVPLRRRRRLPVRLGGQRERLQARAIVQRALQGLRQRGRLDGLGEHVRRLGDGERSARIQSDGGGQIGSRQLHVALLAQTRHFVVVAVRPRRIDVGLGGAASLEQALGVVRLVAAARRRLAEHLQLPLRAHQLVEALLDQVRDLQPLLIDLRLAGGEPEIRGGDVVPPLAAVEDELAEVEPGVGGAVIGAGLRKGHARNHHGSSASTAAGRQRVGTVVGEDGGAGDDAVLLRRKREQDLPLEIGVPLQRQLHRFVQREGLRLLRDRCRGQQSCENQDPEHYAPPPIAVFNTSRRQTQAQSVPISARRVGTSPAAAIPKAIITAAQSEKKSNAPASLRAAPESGCPSEASTAPRSRGARTAGPAGSEVCRRAVNPSSRLAMAPGSRTAAATGKTARPFTRPRRNQTSPTTETPPRSRKSGASRAPDATRTTW